MLNCGPEGVVLPKALTFARWWRLRRSPHTLLRTLQYEALERCSLDGQVLDPGGDRRSGYHRLVDRGRARFTIVNLNDASRPDCLADLEQSLPFLDNAFDHVLSLNTFEHLLNDRFALGECLRVLKAGGEFHIAVPFCYRVHGSPRDFHRHTAEWWSVTLRDLGASKVRVEPLVWDSRSSGAALVNGGRFSRSLLMLRALIDLRKSFIVVARGLGFKSVLGRPLPLPDERERRIRESASAYALGYYISGIK